MLTRIVGVATTGGSRSFAEFSALTAAIFRRNSACFSRCFRNRSSRLIPLQFNFFKNELSQRILIGLSPGGETDAIVLRLDGGWKTGDDVAGAAAAGDIKTEDVEMEGASSLSEDSTCRMIRFRTLLLLLSS